MFYTRSLIELAGVTGCGLLSAAITLCLFGIAVRCRCIYIAPRCTARPRDTIFNPKPTDPSHKRGSAMFGWIRWAHNISYQEMLEGVPGTGTRKGGLEGIMLKVNLDGIVLLRFYALCLRISIFITVVSLGIVLPLNLTGQCTNGQSCFKDEDECRNTASSDITNCYGNYDITTLANISPLTNITTNFAVNWDHVFTFEKAGTFGRLYGIVLCTWFITYYACKCMYSEWIAMLALRRVYYLEKDHWSERRKELENSLLLSKIEDDGDSSTIGKRDAWIPHPEQRETVVNVGLYSVLVGGLPASPDIEIDEEDVEAAIGLANKKKVDWQLEFATKYFDSCVQNPQGYSSAVAAITILPSAFDLSNAWGKWYGAAKKLRRLRFIRQVVEEKTRYNIDCDDDDYLDEENMLGTINDVKSEAGIEKTDFTTEIQHDSFRAIDGSGRDFTNAAKCKKKIESAIYDNTDENREYYRSVLGVEDGSGFRSPAFGPEQTAMYTREFAQGAAGCCPSGCFTGRIRRANIDELRAMEEEAAREVHEANILLENAQFRVLKDKKDIKKEDSFAQQECKNESLTTLYRDGNVRLRKRTKSYTSEKNRAGSDEWAQVEDIINESPRNDQRSYLKGKSITSFGTNEGEATSVKSIASRARSEVRNLTKKAKATKAPTELKDIGKDMKKVVADSLVRESSYAVVTFMSRQAAVAARQCLADGRGQDRWETFSDIPVPPLADAVPYNICFCRGCCRPVSLSIHSAQKRLRWHIAMVLLALIYIFYTVPLTSAALLLDSKFIVDFLNDYFRLNDSSILVDAIRGLLPGLIFTLFYSLCPVMFKMIANFGSNATSQFAAEYAAMKYFWWFYIITAFWSTSLFTIIITSNQTNLGEDDNLTTKFNKVIRTIADTVPTIISISWMNWIIVRTTIILPLHYLLQVNTFLFRTLGWHCCSRAVRGGGPGGTTPYRIYIDGALVFLCAVTLAPAAPLLAPFATVYFIWSLPVLKRNLVYMYRPNFDAGGARWPFLFEMLMTSILVGQVVITLTLIFRQAIGPAIFAFIPFPITYLFRQSTLASFLKAYEDASLFHTSELDGLEPHERTSRDIRESFRRFLVDAHKAAYVPVCLARSSQQESDKGSIVLTSEPSCVINHDDDVNFIGDSPRISNGMAPNVDGFASPRSQYGVSLNRVNRKNAVSELRLNDDGSVTSDLVFTFSRNSN